MFAALAIALIAFLSGAEPAAAHDELISATPAAGSSVEGVPAEVLLAFSGVLSADQGATEVAVLDSTGASVASGAPVVQENTVTQALDAAAAASGELRVLWKVVSGDGHPISGEFAFTVTAPPAPVPTDTAEPEPTLTSQPVSPQPAETAPAPDDAAADDSTAASSPWPWVVGILVGAGIGAAVISLVLSRRRRGKARAKRDANAPGAESEDAGER